MEAAEQAFLKLKERMEAERREKTRPIIPKELKNFTADYPFLAERLALHIEAGRPIYLDERHLTDAEARLKRCNTCHAGEGCLQGGSKYLSGKPMSEENAGQMPCNVDADGMIIYEGCQKWPAMIRRESLLEIGIPKIFLNASLKTYKQVNKNAEKPLNGCRQFIEDIQNGLFINNFVEDIEDNKRKWGLFFSGPFGTGKTHLAIATLIALHDAGEKRLRFVTVPRLMAMARREIDKKENRIDIIDATAKTRGLLVLDDIASEKASEWVAEQLLMLIDERYANRLPTIITTNSNLGDLESRIGGASVSRIWQMCQGFVLDGEDYRKNFK